VLEQNTPFDMTPVPSENLIHLDSQREPESSSSSSMLAILRLLVMFIADIFKSQRRLEAENLFLRHQLNIAMRRAPPRLRLYGSDRALLVWMTRIWPGLLDVSRVAKPETILRWHRSGFKAFWRWKSGNRAGRLKACSSGVGSHYPTTRWRCFRGSRDDGALRGRDANEIERARISMMARSSKAPSIGRIQMRKTNFLQITTFGLQRAAGPYRRAWWRLRADRRASPQAAPAPLGGELLSVRDRS
jgi:hypothetical protein